MPPSMLTRQQAWDLPGFKSPSTWKTPWRARSHLKDFVKSIGSPSSTITWTIGSSPPTNGGNRAYNKNRASLLPELQCITKMALLRGGSGNYNGTYNAHPCPPQVAQCHHSKSMAVCTENGEQCNQCHAKPQVQG